MRACFKNYLASLLARTCRLHSGSVSLSDSLQAVRSILVVKLDAMGDFVLATPFLRQLRKAVPQARICLVVRSPASKLAKACTAVDEVFVLPTDSLPRRFGDLRLIVRYSRFLRDQLHRQHFDLAILPRTGPDNHKARLLSYLSGAPRRVGFSSDAPAFPMPANLTTQIPVPVRHETEANLSLLQLYEPSVQTSPLEINCIPAEEKFLEKLLQTRKVDPARPLMALGIGSSLSHKKWPASQYLRLATHFTQQGWTIAILGDDYDRQTLNATLEHIHVFAGLLSPNQSWSLLRKASVFVGNDSGSMQLAAAANCPCVVILSKAPNDSEPGDPNAFFRFAPFNVPYVTVFPDKGLNENASEVPYEKAVAMVENFLASTVQGRVRK